MTTDIEKILAFAEGSLKKLTAKQEAHYNRLVWVHSMIEQHLSRSKVLPLIQKKYDLKTRHQALVYFNNCQLIFGKTTTLEKRYWVDIMLQKHLKLLKNAEEAGKLELQHSILSKIHDVLAKYESVETEREVSTTVVLSINHNILENAPSVDDVRRQIAYLSEKEHFDASSLSISQYLNKYENEHGNE